MTDYRVTLFESEGPPVARVVIENADSRDAAIDRALEQASSDDVVDDDLRDADPDAITDTEAVALCDFCKAAPHDRVEAEGIAIFIDPSDTMNLPLGTDAPEREVAVCHEHMQAAKTTPAKELVDQQVKP